MNYKNIGLDSKLRKAGSPASKRREWQSDNEQDAQVEKGPYSNPTEIQKGTTDITQGGIINFKDENGDIILTYSP